MTSEPAGVASTSSMPTVTARGDAVVRAEPNEARLWITLSALKPEPPAALADVAARSQSLIHLLDELGVEPADRSTSGITIQEEFDHKQGERRPLGHRASAVTGLRVTDLKLIGQLISRATEEVAARVTGPQWGIALDNPARLEAARQAAVQAQRKAQAYAEGLGAALGRVARVTEPENPNLPTRTASMARAASVGEPLPVEPGEQEVTASVQVTFELVVSDGRI